MRSSILKSVFILGAAAFVIVGSTGAYFSDTAVVTGNQFTTGTWEDAPTERSVASEKEKPVDFLDEFNPGTSV